MRVLACILLLLATFVGLGAAECPPGECVCIVDTFHQCMKPEICATVGKCEGDTDGTEIKVFGSATGVVEVGPFCGDDAYFYVDVPEDLPPHAPLNFAIRLEHTNPPRGVCIYMQEGKPPTKGFYKSYRCNSGHHITLSSQFRGGQRYFYCVHATSSRVIKGTSEKMNVRLYTFG